MPEQRRPYRHGDSVVVALPRAVRAHLAIEPGNDLYFHVVRGSEVVLALTSQREGGRPEGLGLQRELAHARERIKRLEEKVRASWEAAWNEFRAQEAARAVRVELRGVSALDEVNDRLRRIEDQLGTRRGPWAYKVKRARPREVEPAPAPVLDAAAPLGDAPRRPRRRSSPTRLNGIAQQVLAGIAERRDGSEEQETP